MKEERQKARQEMNLCSAESLPIAFLLLIGHGLNILYQAASQYVSEKFKRFLPFHHCIPVEPLLCTRQLKQ